MLLRARCGLVVLVLVWLLMGCAQARAPHVTIAWETANEIGTAGFVIERGETRAGPFTRISTLIPAGDDPFVRHEYEYVDRDVAAGRIYHYQLVGITNRNERNIAGQLSAEAK